MAKTGFANSVRFGLLATLAGLAMLPLTSRADDAAPAESGAAGIPISLMNFEVNAVYYNQGDLGSLTTGEFGWRPEYRFNDQFSVPVRLLFSVMKEAGDVDDTSDDLIYLQTTATVGADYAVLPNVTGGVDLGLSVFDGGTPLVAGIHGLYKLGFADDSILKIIDAVQVGYHAMLTADLVHEVRGGILIRF